MNRLKQYQRSKRTAHGGELAAFRRLCREIAAAASLKASGIDPQSIGGRFRSCRLAEGLSLEEVAKPAGTCKQYVSRFERGEISPTLDTLKRLVEQGLGKRLAVYIE